MKTAAISYVERPDGAFLVAWNRKFGGWGFPGGKVDDGETLIHAQQRELYEETGLTTLYSQFLYSDISAVDPDCICHVFQADVGGVAIPRELNTGLAWVDREFMQQHSFGPEWYRRFFEALDAKRACTSVLSA